MTFQVDAPTTADIDKTADVASQSSGVGSALVWAASRAGAHSLARGRR
jgi:hypothetical protein